MPNHPTRNDRRKGEDRSETLIIPHITKEMVQKAQQMADQGASRAEIEQAIFAMQQAPFQPEPPQTPPPRRGFRVFGRREAAPIETPPTPTVTPPEKPAAADAEPTVAFAPQSEPREEPLPAQEPPQQEEPQAETPEQPAPQTAAEPPQPPQTAVTPAQPAAERPKTAPRSSSRIPRSYQEAEADLNEKIRRDHIWLSNPVMVRGLGLAPVIGAALDGRRALMLCVACLILVTLTRPIAVAVCHLTKNRWRPIIYCYTAAVLYIPTYILLYRIFGADTSMLGIYLPILTVDPAIVKRMEFTELEPVSTALRHGWNNALGMCAALLLVGCLREFLATGSVFYYVILNRTLLPMAALPAGGFVLLGVLAACWCAVVNLYNNYKHEEVRRLYAKRKS